MLDTIVGARRNAIFSDFLPIILYIIQLSISLHACCVQSDKSSSAGVTVYFTPRIKYPPGVTEGWLNDTEMLIEASKMHPAAG